MKTYYFKKTDSLYKIFELFDKLPKKVKEIILYIEPSHEIFSNKWFVKLISEKAQDKGINVIFEIENQKQEKLLKSLSLNYIWKKEPLLSKIRKSFWEFVELLKGSKYMQGRYGGIVKFFIIFVEISLILYFAYFVYNLVTPKTDIYIQPNVRVKTLVEKFYLIPNGAKNYDINNKPFFTYYTGVFTKVYEVKLPVKDISYIAKPAEGLVKFYNYSSVGYSLKAHTQLLGPDGLIFRLQNWVYVPPKKADGNPGTALVKVKADEKDINGQLIGARGNISRGTKLYVRKLYISVGKKLLVAEAVDDFNGGETLANGQVTLQDIQLLKQYLLKNFQKNLKSYVLQYINLQKDQFPLLADNLYGYKNIQYIINAKPGDKKAYLKGELQADIYYTYVKKSEILQAFKKYLEDRIVSWNDFLGWDQTSLQLLNLQNIAKGLYLGTFSINALLGYDFDKDYNGIKEQILEEIPGLSVSQAKKIILSYPTVAGVDIKTTDALGKISDLKSRIFIHIVKN